VSKQTNHLNVTDEFKLILFPNRAKNEKVFYDAMVKFSKEPLSDKKKVIDNLYLSMKLTLKEIKQAKVSALSRNAKLAVKDDGKQQAIKKEPVIAKNKIEESAPPETTTTTNNGNSPREQVEANQNNTTIDTADNNSKLTNTTSKGENIMVPTIDDIKQELIQITDDVIRKRKMQSAVDNIVKSDLDAKINELKEIKSFFERLESKKASDFLSAVIADYESIKAVK
jgi:hypothetical protein